MKRKQIKNFFAVFFLLLYVSPASGADFEELDKPPEGAYKGQFLAGAYASMGIIKGGIAEGEQAFIRGSTYTFKESDTTKALWINHLSYSFGLFAEYMPMDYIGAGSKIAFSSVVQRTDFGKNYANTSAVIFRDVSFMVGPVFHATNRRPWDISLSPMLGFSYGSYYPAPIADKLIEGYSPSVKKGKSALFVFGAELKLSVYFSGGFVLTMGSEWIRNKVSLSSSVPESNPHNQKYYLTGGTSGEIDNLRILVGGGYAFRH